MLLELKNEGFLQIQRRFKYCCSLTGSEGKDFQILVVFILFQKILELFFDYSLIFIYGFPYMNKKKDDILRITDMFQSNVNNVIP